MHTTTASNNTAAKCRDATTAAREASASKAKVTARWQAIAKGSSCEGTRTNRKAACAKAGGLLWCEPSAHSSSSTSHLTAAAAAPCCRCGPCG